MFEILDIIQNEINRRQQEINRLIELKAMISLGSPASGIASIAGTSIPAKRGRKKKQTAIEGSMDATNTMLATMATSPSAVKEKVTSVKVKSKGRKRKKRKAPTTESRIINMIKAENRLMDVNMLADKLSPAYPDKDYSTLTKYFNVVLSNLKSKGVLYGVKYDEKNQKLSRNHWGLKNWFTEDHQIVPEYYLNK